MKLPMKHVSRVLLICGLSGLLIGCQDTELPQPGGGVETEVRVAFKPAPLTAGETVASLDTTGGTGSTTGGGETEPIEEGFGTLKGRVVFQGAIPSVPTIEPNKDTAVCKPMPSLQIVVNPENQGVANVFVYLERAPRGAPEAAAPETDVVFDQKGCRFLPHALVMQANQTVRILSGDPIAHNTHTKPKRQPEFNTLISPNDREGLVTFNYSRAEREPVRVICDFHSWMEAWHLPLDHPYGAVTDENGEFTIENVPSGSHEFQVWHEAAQFLKRDAAYTIQADQETEVTIDYPASAYQASRSNSVKTIKLAIAN